MTLLAGKGSGVTKFANAMTGFSEVVGRSMHIKAFPWNSLTAGSTVVDYGGGNGHSTMDVLRAFPHLKVIVQDLPAVVEEAKTLWDKELPEAVKENKVEFIPFNFLKDAPAPGCSVYYLRHISHNWADDYFVLILSGIKKVMAPHSRILIFDYVLQSVARGATSAFDVAPAPLLPNYGQGKARMYTQSLNMLCICNAKERTLDEFVELGKQAGLKFVKLWNAGEESMVEFAL